MQYIEHRALKENFTLIINNLNLETNPRILASLVQEDVLTVDDLERVKRHKTTQQQNTELYFRIRRCDWRREPFKKFCQVLDQNDDGFISETLKKQRSMAASKSIAEAEKCLYCMLVDNLYPEEIAPFLYEDCELSSGTLQEVTLTEGVTFELPGQKLGKRMSSCFSAVFARNLWIFVALFRTCNHK